ncbi:MAG TPA: endolytic transglycosylase MltG [Chloroflexia bacterium]|nr:endolytic transglycosylase MltG [Chloroflexia bacterium]
MNLIGNVLKAVVAVAMIAAVVVAGVYIYRATEPLASIGTRDTPAEPVMFTIKPGETVSEVADNLEKAGLIDSALIFRARLKLLDVEGQLQAGTFQVTPGTDLDALIRLLTTPIVERGIRFTVIEGMRAEEMGEKLGAEGVVSPTEFIRLTTTPEGAAQYSNDFLAASGKPADRGLEGFLFPDTYEVKQSGSDNSDAVIKIMLETMEERFTPEMREEIAKRQIDGRPATVYEALIIASIVQREGVVKEELADIAAVFWNRVDRGMLLNADPTTQYALGKPGDWWPQLNLDPNTVDHPYNTYKIVGMPPGPIANPGLDALRATVYPSQNNYLYFVAKNDGSNAHVFAETLEEHERNRVLYGNR